MNNLARSSGLAFLWACLVWLAVTLQGPIEGGTRSALVAYLGPVVIGFVGSYLGRGTAGLLGVIAGVVVGNLVAIVTGLVVAPVEGELAVRTVWIVVFAGLAGVGYVVGGWVRSMVSRRGTTVGQGGH